MAIQRVDGVPKKGFSWSEYGEEMQNECSTRLIITNLGSNMVLIQGVEGVAVDEAVERLDEWASFWSEWLWPWDRRNMC